MSVGVGIGIGIYGANGHQIANALTGEGLGRLVATAAFPRESLAASQQANQSIAPIAHYESLEQLLADPRVELVSLCSPRRRDQAGHAIQALRAGKHVYAEKPCAMDEADLDAILLAARETGRLFHEMAGTAFEQPYFAMRQIVREGRIGKVVQVIAEKSYAYHDGRPQDEDVDGGLIGQNAIHAVRFVEHVAGMRIRAVEAMETTFGNPIAGGGLRMAANLMLELENGGLASITANYLNTRGSGVWGDESLRIRGTLGVVESIRGGTDTRLVIGDTNHGKVDTSAPGFDYLQTYLQTIAGQGEMPISLEEELSPTRWVIRAKRKAGRRK